MNTTLIKYNLSYYVKSLKFIGPCLVYIIFLFANYQVKPISIWNNYYITAVAVFVLANWIGTGLVNCEDSTQQCITSLHVRNETLYNLSKVISILIFLLPFYIVLVFYPIVFGFYRRNLLLDEVVVSISIHFLFSLMGSSIGIFFDSGLFEHKNSMLPLHALIMLITILPISLMFKDNALLQYTGYLLPPINFLTEKLYGLKDAVFYFDLGFMIFVSYSIGYSVVLFVVYNFLRKKRTASM